MSHDTNQGQSGEKQTIISFRNSFWLVVIIVGLFIAALNFVKAESAGEEGEGKGKETTEAKSETKTESATGENHDKGEKKAEEATKAEPAKDTAKSEK